VKVYQHFIKGKVVPVLN